MTVLQIIGGIALAVFVTVVVLGVSGVKAGGRFFSSMENGESDSSLIEEESRR